MTPDDLLVDDDLLIDDSEFDVPLYASVQKFEEARHRRDEQGRFTEQATVTVGDRQITVVKPKRASQDKLVPINVVAFDANFQQSPSFYIGVGGSGPNAIGDRYARFGEYIAQHDSIESPEVYVRDDGVVGFTNGRHRYAWLRDHGITSIPVAMEAESVANAKKHGYLAAVKLAWDESQHPRDKEGQFTTFYHGTLQEQVDSIKEHGLQTNRSGLAWPGLSQPGTIYLGRTKDAAMLWAESTTLRLDWKFDNPTAVVLEVRVPDEVLAKSQRTAEPEGNLRVFQDIPPEWIVGVTVGRSHDQILGVTRARMRREEAKHIVPPFVTKAETFYVGLVVEGDVQSIAEKQEHAYGNTQILIAPTSSAAAMLNTARLAIRDDDLMGTGKDVDPNHVTVRYGLVNEDLDGLRTFIAQQTPFDAYVSGIELFPASEHSDGAVPVVARIESPDLHAIEARIGEHADFKEKSFPVYKPHCTLAYCKPEAAPRYADLPIGGFFLVQSITISHASGVQETIPFGMTQKWDPRQPRDAKGRFTDLGLHDGQVTVLHGTTRQNAEAILAGGFKPGNPARVAAQIEGEYGLPKDSILNHVAFEFAKGRRDLGKVHFTTDESVADQYSVPEVMQDALTAAHMLLHPTPEDEPFTKEMHASRKAWIDREATRLADPALLAVTVPFDVVGQHGFGKQFTLEEFKSLLTKFPKSEEDIFNNITIPIEALTGARIERWKKDSLHNHPHWVEAQHPRVPKGSSHGGEFESGPRDALESLLNKEKNVSIDRNNVRAFLERAAQEHGDPNLMDLQVEGMEIFGGNGLGIVRDEMPQIPPEHRAAFLEYAKKRGVTVTLEQVGPLTLKPTQNEISARRVALKLEKYERGKKKFPAVLVSNQNRILDGHHHWGMMAAFTLEFPDAKMPISRLQVSTKVALSLMHDYMKLHKLERASMSGAKVKKWDGSQHPRDAKGEFTGSGILTAMKKNLPNYPSTAVGAPFLLPDGTRLGKDSTHDNSLLEIGILLEDALKEGVIRVKYNGIDMVEGKMTNAQAKTIVDDWIFQQFDDRVVDVRDSTGKNVIRSRVFDDRVTATALRNYVNMVQKADETGRYVTPFVSFDKQGDEQLRMIASLNSSRLATWGFTAEAETLGMARYKLSAVLDGRTSLFCEMINGKIFNVLDARKKVIDVLNVQNPEDLRVVQPWPKQTKAAMAQYAQMTGDELTQQGLHIPPYHPHCRTICRAIKSSAGEETETVPTVPDGTEAFQPVTQADLKELGIDATQEDVDQWNEHVGMSPVELLSKFSGLPPQEVMTKGQGVGSNPIDFGDDGNIGFNVRGATPAGVEFKLNAILEPFTGIYYLTQADLLAGSPKAELAFVKQMFSSLIDMGIQSSATELAVGVGGNAPYYARLGFLPDDLEWDSLRKYALEGDTMIPTVLESLAPEDRLLVEHLLQDQSVQAMQALVELPFTYEGKTIGEWLFGEAEGTWTLDLTDEDLIEQTKAYLS